MLPRLMSTVVSDLPDAMVKLFSLFTAAVLGTVSVTATYIVSYQGNVLDLAYNEVTDFSVVNTHYLTSPAQSNQNVG